MVHLQDEHTIFIYYTITTLSRVQLKENRFTSPWGASAGKILTATVVASLFLRFGILYTITLFSYAHLNKNNGFAIVLLRKITLKNVFTTYIMKV